MSRYRRRKNKASELAKTVIDFCVNHNGCKLLNMNDTGFFIRNRQENCFYYEGKFYSPHRFEVKKIQYLENGHPVSLFMSSLGAALDDEDPDDYAEQVKSNSETIVDHSLSTPEDANEIIQIMLQHPVEWDDESEDEWNEILKNLE